MKTTKDGHRCVRPLSDFTYLDLHVVPSDSGWNSNGVENRHYFTLWPVVCHHGFDRK